MLFQAILTELTANGHLKESASNDILAVRVAKVEPGGALTYAKGIEKLGHTTNVIYSIQESRIRLFEDVVVGAEVFVFGYPSSLGLKMTPQLEVGKPLLRRGIVAGRNEKRETIILDCPVYGGNSGGPVIQKSEAADGMIEHVVIGLVAQYVPFVESKYEVERADSTIRASETEFVFANSGYAVAIPMDPVMALVQGFAH